MKNPFKLLRDLQPKPQLIPTSELKHLTDEDRRLITQIGITSQQLFKSMQAETTVNYDRSRFYQDIVRACVTGDTRIWLLNGTTPTIKEMAENEDKYIGKYTFSINPNTKCLEPDKILFIKKTRELTDLVRVWLDNSKYVDCTPDHRFMLRDGSYKEAQDLKPNDSLMPLYIKFYKRGLSEYPLAYNPGTTKYRYIHQLVAKLLYGYKSNHGLIIHHKNFDVMDNDPSNLEMMGSSEHKELHGKYAHRKHNVESCKCFVCKAMRGETGGENSPGFGKEPWNKGKTKNTNQTIAKSANNQRKVRAFITSICACGCGEQFRNNIQINNSKSPLNIHHKYIIHHNLRAATWNSGLTKDTSDIIRKIAEKNSCRKNHKVVKVEKLNYKQDVYDLGVKNNHNFPLACGVFVHNCEHWMVGPALELYADYVSNYNHIHGASVWITSENPVYQKELDKLLDRIGIEEKIFDWAWTTAGFGDLFIKIHGIPNDGVISIDDDEHPLNTSRVDYEGTLIGFYKTPQGQTTGTGAQELIAPWCYVHMRILGAKRKRPQYADQNYSEFRTMHLMSGTDTKQVSSRYGTSVILNAIPVWKRLRLAEDSLLMARLTRGIIRYIWKLKVDSNNAEATNELLTMLVGVLKKARALDTSSGSPNFDSKFGVLCLSGDTRIELCDGSNPTIKEIVTNRGKYINKYLWTINDQTGGVEPKRILDAIRTGINTQLVCVTLDNGQMIKCTPDHRFMLRDGSYKQAKDLQPNDSLMPYYTRMDDRHLSGYKLIYDPTDNKYRYAHKIITGKVKRGFVVHHLDYNKLNNDPSNLVICSNYDHTHSYHSKHRPETIEKMRLNRKPPWSKGLNKDTSEILRRKAGEQSEWFKEFYKTERGKSVMAKMVGTHQKNIKLGKFIPLSGNNHPNHGKTWEDMYGVDGAKIHREKMIRVAKGAYTGRKLSEEWKKKISEGLAGNKNGLRVKAFRTKFCACGCGGQFKEDFRYHKDYIHGHNKPFLGKKHNNQTKAKIGKLGTKKMALEMINIGYTNQQIIDSLTGFYINIGRDKHKALENAKSCLYHAINDVGAVGCLNHKVVKVGWLGEKQDVYDLTIDGNHNFAISQGIFVHNSSVEDLLIPVWGDVNDLTYDKIGEEADIRWITDIKELRNQLACALRTPLPVLGGYIEEATGPLGAQSIEKLSVEFAHTARRLQRALKSGIKRICQIHLAYMNMDPDPRLFEVEMSETSTAEEEALRDSLDKGVDVIQKIVDMVESADPEINKKEVIDYLNKKLLKLEDFDLDSFSKVKTTKFKESKELIKKNGAASYIPVVHSDLVSYLPLNEQRINEAKATVGSILNTRWESNWKLLFEGSKIIERELEKAPNK